MRRPTETLREEHRALVPHIAFIRAAAEAVGQASLDEVREDADEVIGFLAHDLLPHAELEERILYPAVAKLLGSPDATRTMSRDHVEVDRLTDQLRRLRPRLESETLAPADARELRRVLYGLHAIVSVHFAKEEEIYLPLLEARLTAAEAEALALEMAQAGTAAHAR